jgi:predicted NBD/HSP70 family sugar kinase
VLRTLQSRGTVSRPELAKATGLSQPTVNEISALLLRSGRVVEAPLQAARLPAKRGPKATLLSFNAAAGHVLGIDISAEQVIVLAADLAGRIQGRVCEEVGPRRTLRPELLLARVREAMTTVLRGAGIARSGLLGVGVSVPGIIDPASGLLSLAPSLPGWDGLPVAARLKPGFPCPVIANCDLHLAIIAERAFGAAKNTGDAIYVHLGAGIGLGILMHGAPYLGSDGAAGQIGFLRIGEADMPPQSGYGLFEWAAGSTAFGRLARRAIAKAPKTSKLRLLAGRYGAALGPHVVFDAAAAGDADARQILTRLIEQIARGIAAVICVLNPETVILGGEIAQADDLLIQPLRARVAELVPCPPRRFAVSVLGENSAALGAVQVALQQAQDRIFDNPTTPPGGRNDD